MVTNYRDLIPAPVRATLEPEATLFIKSTLDGFDLPVARKEAISTATIGNLPKYVVDGKIDYDLLKKMINQAAWR